MDDDTTTVQLMTKYEAEVGTDKISLVNRQVDEVKSEMENNINKVMQNTENLSDVMNKTELMAAGASTFQKRSESIAKALWWRNFKMKLIIGLLVGAILGYIFIPIIIEAGALTAVGSVPHFLSHSADAKIPS